MPPNLHRGKLTTALVIATAVWPAGADAGTGPHTSVLPAGVPVAEVTPSQDLRSPDARDAAREAAVAPADSTRMPPGRPAPPVADAFKWSDAGIGAAAMLTVASVASGTLLLVGRRRHRTRTT